VCARARARSRACVHICRVSQKVGTNEYLGKYKFYRKVFRKKL